MFLKNVGCVILLYDFFLIKEQNNSINCARKVLRDISNQELDSKKEIIKKNQCLRLFTIQNQFRTKRPIPEFTRNTESFIIDFIMMI